MGIWEETISIQHENINLMICSYSEGVERDLKESMERLNTCKYLWCNFLLLEGKEKIRLQVEW